MKTGDRKKAFPNFDRDLAKAVSKDMAAYEGEVMSSVARRCKQAGMHWRLHNAACVCAIIARLRSVA